MGAGNTRAAPGTTPSIVIHKPSASNPTPEQLSVMSVTAGTRDPRLPVNSTHSYGSNRGIANSNRQVKDSSITVTETSKFNMSIVIADKSAVTMTSDEADDKAVTLNFKFQCAKPVIVTASLNTKELWQDTPTPHMRFINSRHEEIDFADAAASSCIGLETKFYAPGTHTYTTTVKSWDTLINPASNTPLYKSGSGNSKKDSFALGVLCEVIPDNVYSAAINANAIDEDLIDLTTFEDSKPSAIGDPDADHGSLLKWEDYEQVWNDITRLPMFEQFMPESKTLYYNAHGCKDLRERKAGGGGGRAGSLVKSFYCGGGKIFGSVNVYGMSNGGGANSGEGKEGDSKEDEEKIGNMTMVVMPEDALKPTVVRMTAEEGKGGDDSDDDDEKNCVICLTERKNIIVKPCMHLCLCKDCAEMLPRKMGGCPVCRGKVEGFLQCDMMK
jgi:hypothetical protein